MKSVEPKLGDFTSGFMRAVDAFETYSNMREVPGGGSNDHRTLRDSAATRRLLALQDSEDIKKEDDEFRKLVENGVNLIEVLMENKSLKAELSLEQFNNKKLYAIIKVLETEICEMKKILPNTQRR